MDASSLAPDGPLPDDVPTLQDLVQGDTGPDGTRERTFRPNDPINRAEASKIIALLGEAMREQ